MINNLGSETQYLNQVKTVPMGQLPNAVGAQSNSTSGQNVSSGSAITVDSVKNIATEKVHDNAVTQAAQEFDIFQHPVIMTKNILLCFLMSAGFTRATNWLMSSKNIADGATQLDDFRSNRIYQFGEKIDNSITKTAAYSKVSNAWGSTKATLAKIPVPNFIKEIYSKMKIGSFAPWDKSGMYSLGKGVESMNEAIEFISGIPSAELKNIGLAQADYVHLTQTLEAAKKGVITNSAAFKKIFEKGYMANLSANTLKSLQVNGVNPNSLMRKFFGVVPDVNLSLSKAMYYNGLHNQGPIAKAMQKIVGYVGEASGNGVLGGMGGIIMGSLGLITGFNAASRAEKGDKLRAFMEDYLGFTLGAYLMSFVVGKWFHKFLGITELGLDPKAVRAIADKLKIEAPKGLVLETVEAYNRQLKEFKQVQTLIDQIDNNKLNLDGNFLSRKFGMNPASQIKKLLNLETLPGDMTEVRRQLVELTGGKSYAHLDAIRNEIKSALKSKITIGSIFKANEHNTGNFLSRLGKYIVQKPLRKFGQFLSVGKYTLLTKNTLANHLKLRHFRRIGGCIGRMILVAVVLTDPFRNMFMKASHLIFGKPKHSQMDEDKREKEKEEKLKQQQELPKVNVINRDNVKPGENLLQKALASSTPKTNQVPTQQPQQSQQAQQDASTAVAPVLTEVKRTYIPSPNPNPAIFNAPPTQQETAINNAFAKADAAEQAALKFVK